MLIGKPFAVKPRTIQVCLNRAASYYKVPVLLLDAILWQEGGTDGVGKLDPNGTYDLGLAQINSQWLQVFARDGITAKEVLDNPCENIYAAGYILDKYVNLFGGHNWFYATMAYNIGPSGAKNPILYRIGYRYASNVIRRWWLLYDEVRRH